MTRSPSEAQVADAQRFILRLSSGTPVQAMSCHTIFPLARSTHRTNPFLALVEGRRRGRCDFRRCTATIARRPAERFSRPPIWRPTWSADWFLSSAHRRSGRAQLRPIVGEDEGGCETGEEGEGCRNTCRRNVLTSMDLGSAWGNTMLNPEEGGGFRSIRLGYFQCRLQATVDLLHHCRGQSTADALDELAIHGNKVLALDNRIDGQTRLHSVRAGNVNL